MPELPEVETIRRGLRRKIVGKEIKAVTVKKSRLVKGVTKKFISTLKGNAIRDISRRGKLLIFKLSKSKQFLLIHLKLTGQLVYQKGRQIVGGGHGELEDEKLPGKHTHIIFDFADGSRLFFNDLRQFGYMKLVDEKGLKKVLAEFGVEPLDKDFTFGKFRDIIDKRKVAVKQVLMNQKLIAGLGNIYADEVCFYAKVRPNRKASSLSNKEIKELYQGCKKILKQAIAKRGTTFNNYRDADGNIGGFRKILKIYHRQGQKCKRCKKGIIKKIRIAGRGTHFCPVCQR